MFYWWQTGIWWFMSLLQSVNKFLHLYFKYSFQGLRNAVYWQIYSQFEFHFSQLRLPRCISLIKHITMVTEFIQKWARTWSGLILMCRFIFSFSVIDLTAASSHFFPMPYGSVVAPPAVSSPPCRREPRLVVRQVERTQPRIKVLLGEDTTGEPGTDGYHRWDR